MAGLRAWRWLMIFEGIPSVLVGIAAYLILPTSPATAKFLSPEERALLVEIRLREVGQTASAQEYHWSDVREGMKDWQIWIFSFAAFTNDIMLYGFSTFLPTIIKGIGKWTSPQARKYKYCHQCFFLRICAGKWSFLGFAPRYLAKKSGFLAL